METMTYKCKCCGWEKSIPAAWADVSPRFCPTNSCDLSAKKSKGKKSFRSHPEMLERIIPAKKVEVVQVETPQPKVKKKK